MMKHTYSLVLTTEEQIIVNKTPHGRLGFAVLLKHFQNEGRFPEHLKDVPHVVLVYLCQPNRCPRSSLEDSALDGRTAKRDRKEILTPSSVSTGARQNGIDKGRQVPH
ncbi:MAG: DUF4158 domain-containing protein [Moraxellaceae bacterium]|nr:DUF4158 domain-containing protein [Moraxellaceae bacterium]